MSFPVEAGDVDIHGHALLLSSNVLDVISVDLSGTRFWSPVNGYTGFAADGYLYDGSSRVDAERAGWAAEGSSSHRGPQNQFPRRCFVVLTDVEIAFIDASDLTLFYRVYASVVPVLGDELTGIFVELVPDDAVSVLGTLLGRNDMTFSGLAWADGALFIATSNGIRCINFIRDFGEILLEDGTHFPYGALEPAAYSYFSLRFRNQPSYFSDSPHPSPDYPGGLNVTSAICAAYVGSVVYVAFASTTQVGVLAPTSLPVTDPILLHETHVTALSDVLQLFIHTDGALYGLRVNGSDQLELFRSLTEWRSGPFDGGLASLELPLQAGEEGRFVIFGDEIFVGAGSGVYRVPITLEDFVFQYGKTLSGVELLPSANQILTPSNAPVTDVAVDPTTGHLLVLHGTFVDEVDLGQHILKNTYSNVGDPAVPVAPKRLLTFGFKPPEAP